MKKMIIICALLGVGIYIIGIMVGIQIGKHQEQERIKQLMKENTFFAGSIHPDSLISYKKHGTIFMRVK